MSNQTAKHFSRRNFLAAEQFLREHNLLPAGKRFHEKVAAKDPLLACFAFEVAIRSERLFRGSDKMLKSMFARALRDARQTVQNKGKHG